MYYSSYYDEREEKETQEFIEGMRRWMAELVKDKEASERFSAELGLKKKRKHRSKKSK